MKDSLATKLHRRELNDAALPSRNWRTLYSDRRLIHDLDIINELDGHTGCVNALSWSKDGHLLASGSDDQYLNIHSYQPAGTGLNNAFQLTASVATGHTQNIFSVKFMPHSSDRTVITAAGDSQVRIFDLEYAGTTVPTSRASALASESRRRGRNSVHNGVRYLSDGDTNARVYRSHGDRVKRIVTESSPHLFLTCSEDGEVRQWDLRQPSSAYPEPRGSRSDDSSIPPALISYKRYGLDLNTISCSPSQPHYIALGGAHLHAFLHDRRMAGRDKLKEMGRPLSSIGSLTADEQEMLSQATQCVKKFAPKGQQRMKGSDRGHITACKISDARPDEMIVSWSGDHIYSFDLIRSLENEDDDVQTVKSTRVKEGKDRKRKRKAISSEDSLGQQRATSASRTTDASEQETALRIRYQNGQTEDIPIHARAEMLSERQRVAEQIVRATVRVRSLMFGSPQTTNSSNHFSLALAECAGIITQIDEVMRTWGYPMSPEPETVYLQQSLRRVRERTRKFVQAAGTLARTLGGKLLTVDGTSIVMSYFAIIENRTNSLQLTTKEIFCYDFIRAIVCWIESGVNSLIDAFTCPSDMDTASKAASQLPIPEAEGTEEAINEYLIPYLLHLADEDPIVNVETNRFEVDETRRLFNSEREAVLAFASAVEIPFADLSSAVTSTDGESGQVQAQDRQAAHKHWIGKVARGLLLRATSDLKHSTVDRCFGGAGRPLQDMAAEESVLDFVGLGSEDEDEQAEQLVSGVEITDVHGNMIDRATTEDLSAATSDPRRQQTITEGGENEGNEEIESEDEDEDEDVDDLSDASSEPDELDGVPRYLYRHVFGRRGAKSKVEANVPCSRPIRQYRGHCNVKTVKDVNYFGPDEEYVVSGSDDGHLFIWDRKTSELVNILEGDGEVVNVVQGHPYETMLAVSGIDNTVKIFSPDARAREIARLGQGVFAHDPSSFSSISRSRMASGRRAMLRREPRSANEDSTSSSAHAQNQQSAEERDNDEYVAPNGLASRQRLHDAYRIMQHNNMEREEGTSDAFTELPPTHILQLLFGQLGNAGFRIIPDSQ